MPRSITITCSCGRKHKLTRDGESLRQEVIEPEKPADDPKEKKKTRTLLSELFGDDDE